MTPNKQHHVFFHKRLMIYVLAIISGIFVSCLHIGKTPHQTQYATVSALFEEIRHNEAMLQYFFTQMPKGGDLHNHLTGSVYAETYFNIALRDNMWLNTTSYDLHLDAVCEYGEHPIMLYHKSNVPIVLSTDDPGVLRTNLTQQFVIAALRYPDLKYKDFRNFVLNSIRYSFMPDDVKEKELYKLIEKLKIFDMHFSSY